MNLSASDEALARSCRFNNRFTVHTQNPGNNLGDQSGGSLLFQDHRPYFPGDDIRRIDWRAFGRTDQLVLKTYQEEISPFLEILVDVSASMNVAPAKRAATERWTWFLATVGIHAGYTVTVQRLGLDTSPLRPHELLHHPWRYDPHHHLPTGITRQWNGRHRSLRVILSDFLHDISEIEPALATVARDSLALYGLQILTPDELDPSQRGPYRLVDDDTGTIEQLNISDAELAQYRQRFHNHHELLRTGFRRRAGALALVDATADSRQVVLKTLVPTGILALD
jgi:uncharacterized protein (DUF58 family)